MSIPLESYSKLTEDEGIRKHIIKKGSGPSAQNNYSIEILIKMRLDDGTVVLDSSNKNAPFTFITGRDQVFEGLERAVLSMTVGEEASFVCQANYAYGDNGYGRKIPPKSALIYDITMLRAEARRDMPWELNEEKRLNAAEQLKDKGNAFFKQTNFAEANKRYELGIKYLENDGQGGVKEILNSLHLNASLMEIKLENYSSAVEHATKALEINDLNAKAWFRRALGNEGKGAYKEAIEDCKRAMNLEPNDAVMLDGLKRIETKMKKVAESEKTVYRKMFQ
eukprot:TRINITY_DN6303_c0_g1_i1.p1 TRINITY_DN6303_c0_g1~~TRINITY_DN6303_c0_g1_i1.p1  ORF type:complete len:280 (-),score=66.58 TRINITY_DN6303_c0_g1_i1:113-952(-)